MNRQVAGVLVALALLVGGYGVARYVASSSRTPGAAQQRAAAGARMRAKAKGKMKAAKAKRGKAKGKPGKGGAAVEAKALAPIVAGPARQPLTKGPPNVVLIIGCTMRADQVTPYGGHPRTTPFLASRAEEGVLFESGVSAAPWTKAASTAIVTGHHAAEVGMVEPSGLPSRRVLPDEVDTLAELFEKAGYQTFGVTANPNLNEVFGFGQGFEGYLEGTELWRLGGRSKVNGRQLLGRAMPMLAELRDPERPFYGQFLFTDAHGPSTVKPLEVAPYEDGGSRAVAEYRAMLHRLDMSVQVLEGSLAHQGITRENTIFVMVSDHGEGLGEPSYNDHGHGRFTYPATVRMPWIVWGQGVAEGHRVSGVASQIDVMPTLTALAGVQGYSGDGRSWAAAVRGETDHTDRQQAFVDTWFDDVRRSGVYTADRHCHDDWENVIDGEGNRRVPRACYTSDAELVPVEDARSEKLLADLSAFHVQMDTAFAKYPHTKDIEPNDDVKEELQSLGYVARDPEE
ncbi:MAG: sulfatase [Myxococcota bacterium]